MDQTLKLILGYIIVFIIMSVITSVMFMLYDGEGKLGYLIAGGISSGVLLLMMIIPGFVIFGGNKPDKKTNTVE